MTTEFTKTFLTDLRPEINAALEGVAKKHGIGLRLGNGTFTPKTATFKLEAVAADTSGKVVSAVEAKARNDWDANAQFVGLDPKWLGAKFQYSGATCVVLGMMPRRKYPILVDKGGKQVLLPLDAFKALMESQTKKAA